jgi:hypothetical protein
MRMRSVALLCIAMFGTATLGCSALARADAKGSGSLAGVIQHPAQAVPAMRICAIGSGAPAQARRVCVTTRNGDDTYRIDGLPADEYIVIARTEQASGLYRVGGHMQAVQCIRAPCPAMPKAVKVEAGAQIEGVDLNEFYERREDFPAL